MAPEGSFGHYLGCNGGSRVSMRFVSASGDAFDLDLALAALDADAGDHQMMFRLLVERLSAVLGPRLRVERGSLLKRNGPIRRLEISLGASELIAELGEVTPRFSIARVSGGIKIRTEPSDAASWLRLLLESLNEEAQHSATVRQALEAIIIGGN